MKRLQIAAMIGTVLLATAPVALRAQEPDESEKRAEARELERVVRARLAGSGAYLGVALEEVSADDVTRLGLEGEYGGVVTRVSEESPAAAAGLQDGDVITRWNGERVESVAMLIRLVRETPPGRRVSLGVFRDGSERTFEVELADRSKAAGDWAYAIGPEMRERLEEMRERLHESREKMRLSEEERREVREKLRQAHERMRECVVKVEVDENGDGVKRRVTVLGGRGRMGVRLQDLTDQLGDYFGVEGGAGALVSAVTEDSPAAAAGMRAGDVIVAVGSTTVEDPGDVARVVREAEAGPVEVTIIRDGQRRNLTVTLEEPAEGDCEDIFVAPAGDVGSLRWHSEDGGVHVLPHGALAPEVRGFVLPALPHALPVPPHPYVAPFAPGEVESAPAPPAAPLPPARTV